MEGTEVEVERVRGVGPGTVALELSEPGGWGVAPGGFVQVGAPVGGEFVVRHYTVSSPYPDGSFEITVGVDEEGELSPVLAELDEGDYVSVDGPFGRAVYEGEEVVVVLAGGPGVGPAVGIGERAADEHGAGSVTVVYRDDAPAHADRLDSLRDDGATVSVLGGEEPIRDAVGEALGEAPDAQVFVYGFGGFVREAKAALDESGYDGEPKVENFG